MKNKYFILTMALSTILLLGNGYGTTPTNITNQSPTPKITETKSPEIAGFMTYDDGKMRFQYPSSWQKDTQLDTTGKAGGLMNRIAPRAIGPSPALVNKI